ncbi:MAG TPA: DUF445 domain-containing protein, partial [Xanthobacteraceae bacterium]|nr:DUF445 domain-containing protein [Xanthobacteraceae bacterium]
MPIAAEAGAAADADHVTGTRSPENGVGSRDLFPPMGEARAAMLRSGLRRMRVAATLLLVAMTAIFIFTSVTTLDWPWLPYVRAFAEAGMVGACADWFAIVALFRRPLGLPIPHTGIIPSNKERIGGALSRFMTNNFLTAPVLNERLARVDAVGSVARWLENEANTKRLAAYLALMLPRVVATLPGARIGERLGTLAQQALAGVPAAPAAAKLLQIAWAQGEAQELVARAIEYGHDYLAANKDYLSGKIAEQSSRWIPKWIDKIIADKVMGGILSTLSEMRDPEHPWRVELHRGVERLIERLASDPQMHARAEAFKAE